MMKKIQRIVLIVIVFMCVFSSAGEVSAATGLTIRYNGKKYNYKNAQVKFTYNGSNINLHGTPGVILNNNSMGYYVDIFQTALKADCIYDKTTKKLTITKCDKTVTLKLNSKVARVNGKKKTMEVPMREITYVASKKKRLMVPVGFVAKNLGYTYTWNKKSKTGVIKSSWMELNIDGMWTKYKGTKVKTSYNGKNISYGKMPGIVLNNNALINGKKVFEQTLGATCTYDSVEDTITIKKGKTTIVYSADSNVATVNGIEQAIDITAQRVTNRATGKNYLMVPARFTAVALGYYYNWNNTTKTSEITDVPAQSVVSDAAVYFSLPSVTTATAITTEDMYYNNQFSITLNEDIQAFLQTSPISITNPIVTDYKIAVQDGKTTITFTTSKIQGFKASIQNDMVCIQVGDPSTIYKNIVVLDCGHGGTDAGAIGGDYKEKNLNYDILYTYAKRYFDAPSSNIKVYWTRYNDTLISLNDRAAFASKVGADAFISLHMNSATTTSASGTEVYYCTTNNTALANGFSSSEMAKAFLPVLVSTMQSTSRGVKTANYVVIKNNTVPAILIELGFISNDTERQKLVDPTYQDAVAKNIYQVTETLFQTYPTGR